MSKVCFVLDNKGERSGYYRGDALLFVMGVEEIDGRWQIRRKTK